MNTFFQSHNGITVIIFASIIMGIYCMRIMFKAMDREEPQLTMNEMAIGLAGIVLIFIAILVPISRAFEALDKMSR